MHYQHVYVFTLVGPPSSSSIDWVNTLNYLREFLKTNGALPVTGRGGGSFIATRAHRQTLGITEPHGLDPKFPCARDTLFGHTPLFLSGSYIFFSGWANMNPPSGETFGNFFGGNREGRTESTNNKNIFGCLPKLWIVRRMPAIMLPLYPILIPQSEARSDRGQRQRSEAEAEAKF